VQILKVNLLEKKIRAEVIKKYLNRIGTNECVCFTCGNASKYLREAGLDVISIGKNEELKPNRWFEYEEIINTFKAFNATSGYLNINLLNRIGLKMKEILGELEDDKYLVPTGSGETILALIMAYPKKRFYPLRLGTMETKYDEGNPLNMLLEAILDRDKLGKK
jgi:hypothetical protein